MSRRLGPRGRPWEAAPVPSAMASLSLTQRWLADAAQRYPDPARVFADVDAVLAAVPTLRPKSDVYSACAPRCAAPADPTQRSMTGAPSCCSACTACSRSRSETRPTTSP